MITSMTGFASVRRDREEVTVAATARAVNHRFLDLQLRMPASLGAVEAQARGAVQKRVARGRIELSLAVQDRRRQTVSVALNDALVRGIAEAVSQARDAGVVCGPLTPSDLLRLPDVIRIEQSVDGADETLTHLALDAIEGVLEELDLMRRREGEFLGADLESRREGLGVTIDQLAAAAEDGRTALEARLTRRVQELAVDAAPEPAVLAQEIVRFAARSDISEEVVRFKAHLEHWRGLAAAPEPCGRKLDFLLQEMNREINTIGSKAEGIRVPELVVHAKAELEKMREQVQNVE